MEDGPPRFQRDYTSPAVLRYRTEVATILTTGLSPSLASVFHPTSSIVAIDNFSGHCRASHAALQPCTYNAGRLTYVQFGLFRVRSPLLAESHLISFPEGTEMFHFPSFATLNLCVQKRVVSTLLDTGFPIRRSTDRRLFQLPVAYRSLPRPSSPLGAKASTKCP